MFMSTSSICFIPSTPFSLPLPLYPPPVRTRRRPPTPRFHPKATSDLTSPPPTPPLPHPPLQTTPPRLLRILRALYPFSRPHTIHGTIISIISLTILAALLTSTPLSHAFLTLRSSLPPALLTNLYIVGLNQLHDIPLDAINKPHLPLPSGRLTPPEARFIITVALSLALLSLSIATTPALTTVVLSSTLLGTAYSAPPLRLKRFAALASAAIMAVRGLLINSCFFLHASATATATATLPPLILFALAFFTLFGTVIALLKDVPDIPGDRKYGIRTFSVRLGAAFVFRLCVAVLVFLFLSGAAVYAAAAWPKLIAGALAPAALALLGGIVHLFVAAWLCIRAAKVDAADRSSVTQYYMHAWKVFYLEYLLLPLAAL